MYNIFGKLGRARGFFLLFRPKIRLARSQIIAYIKSMNKSLRSILSDLYLEYVNDYLTIEKFAEHKEISENLARQIINEGRAIHEQNCK